MPPEGSTSDPTFTLPAPPTLDASAKRILWATQYYVPKVNAVGDGEPLLDEDGEPLGPELSPRDWCNAAIEGTVGVRTLDGQDKLYNYAGRAATAQVDCRVVLGSPHLPTKINRARFTLARGPFGDGVENMFLVPFRTIAVDKRQLNGLKYGTAVYIPLARGTQITLPSGATAIHDGYFFAADTGGMIKENHIDVFTGIVTEENNPFENFVKSSPQKTFEAFLINDPAITEALKKMHTPPGRSNMTTVQQFANAISCNTGGLRPLNDQILEILLSRVNTPTHTSLVRCDDIPLLKIVGPSTIPMLQTAARAGLAQAIEDRGQQFRLRHAFRTIAQQYVLHEWVGHCDITQARRPGNSDHERGLAIDIPDNAAWRTALQNNGWRWAGNDDPGHFSFIGGSVNRDLHMDAVESFQILWNRNNPGDPIAEDGIYGPETEKRLRLSPIEGFPIVL